MIAFISLCALLVVVSGQFGLDPHHGHFGGTSGESSEHGQFTFYYEPTGKYMVMRTTNYCYLMSLDTNQQHSVHTYTGLENLELTMAAMIKGGEDEILPENLAQHTRYLDNLCDHRVMKKVGDVAMKTTTTAMP